MTRAPAAAPAALQALAVAIGLLGPALPEARADEPRAPAATSPEARKADPAAQKAAAEKAAAALAGKPATTTPAAGTIPPVAEVSELNVEKRLDIALERYYARDYLQAAAALHELYRRIPETDVKRDTVGFYLAEALSALGLHEAAIDHHFDIVNGRRSPDLVARSLTALDQLVRRGQLDDRRLIEGAIFGAQFSSDLQPETAQFVEFHQGLGELRRGFATLGLRRLEELAKSPTYYGWKSQYTLAVERLAQKTEKADDLAEQTLKAVIAAEAAPRDVKNDARVALARTYYEQKKYAEAYAAYADNDSPITGQQLLLVERAWAKVGAGDEQRALGQVVGLGAPVYRLAFSPERYLIRAASLDRLCQYRAAHLAVAEFRRTFFDTLLRVRDRQPLGDDPVLKQAALLRKDLLPTAVWRAHLEEEKAILDGVADKPLRDYLGVIYAARAGQADAALSRGLDRALEAVADDLLAVDEQMTILDYEIGVGLFKGVTGDSRGRAQAALSPIRPGGDRVYHKFTGEYWSDEIGDYEVRAADRCLR